MTKRFLLAEDLPNKMEELRAKYNERALDPTQLSALHKTYLKENTPDDCDILEKFNIQPDKLLKGIQCEQCGFLPMKRIKGMWCCPICPWVSDVAHYQKLYGFSLIIKNTISTSEACQLFMFNHPQQVRKMLQKMNLTPVGERKSRIYLLNSGVLKNIKFLKK